MLGHVRQGENDLVFDELQDIETLRAQNTLGRFVVVKPAFGIEIGFRRNELQTAVDLDRKNKGLHATLAHEHRARLDIDTQETLAVGVGFTAHRPDDLGTFLRRQIANQALKAGNTRPPSNLAAQPGKHIGIYVRLAALVATALVRSISTRSISTLRVWTHIWVHILAPSILIPSVLVHIALYRPARKSFP